MEARGGPSLYGPPTLLQCKNNGFCNISCAMEAPWRLGEARLCTGLHRFCIVKTRFFRDNPPGMVSGPSRRRRENRLTPALAAQSNRLSRAHTASPRLARSHARTKRNDFPVEQPQPPRLLHRMRHDCNIHQRSKWFWASHSLSRPFAGTPGLY